MNTLRHLLHKSAVLAAASLASCAILAISATPATAAGACSDVTTSSGGIFIGPGPGADQVGSFNAGKTFNLSCVYYVQPLQNDRWYAETGNAVYGSSHKKYGYIWVQRLNYGSKHKCNYFGDVLSIPTNPFCSLITLEPTIEQG